VLDDAIQMHGGLGGFQRGRPVQPLVSPGARAARIADGPRRGASRSGDRPPVSFCFTTESASIFLV
jgi:hypothetical protein